MSGNAEWDAAVHVLAALDTRGPCGMKRGEVLAYASSERIDWISLYERFRVASSGERLMLDVGFALWTGAARDHDGAPLVPLGVLVTRLDDRFFAVVLDAIRIRRGLPVGAP